MKACPSCKKQIADDANPCPHCGKKFQTLGGIVVAILIGLLLGGFFFASR